MKIDKANARLRDKETKVPVRAGDTLYRFNTMQPCTLDSWTYSPRGSTLRVVPSGKKNSELAAPAEFGLEVYDSEACRG